MWKILNATYSIFALIINHLQLKVDAGFFHLQYIPIEYHPIEAEGGRYGRSRSISFCRQDLKRQNNLILRVGLLYRGNVDINGW